jgi:hypothetical protein
MDTQGGGSSSNIDRTGGAWVYEERGGSEPAFFPRMFWSDLAEWYRLPNTIPETKQEWGIPLLTLPSFYTVVFIMKLRDDAVAGAAAAASGLVASSSWLGDVDRVVNFPDGLIVMHNAGQTRPSSAHWEVVDQLKDRMPRGAGAAGGVNVVLVDSAPENLKWSEVAAYISANYPAGWRLPTLAEAQNYLTMKGGPFPSERYFPVSDVPDDYVSAGGVGARFKDLISSAWTAEQVARLLVNGTSPYKSMLLVAFSPARLGDVGGADTVMVQNKHYPKHSHEVYDDAGMSLPPRARTYSTGGAKGGDDFGGYYNTDDPNHITYGFSTTISGSTTSSYASEVQQNSGTSLGKPMNTLPAYAAVDFYRKKSSPSPVEGAAGDVLLCCDTTTGDGDITGLSFPAGMIVMWFPQAPDDGSVAPHGWQIYAAMNDKFPRGNGTKTQAVGGGADSVMVPVVHHTHERQGVYSYAFQFNWYTDGDRGSNWKTGGNRTLHVDAMGGQDGLSVVPAYMMVIFLIKL